MTELRFQSLFSLISILENVPDSAPPDDLTRMNVFGVVGRLVVATLLIHKPRAGSALNAVADNEFLTAADRTRGEFETEIRILKL